MDIYNGSKRCHCKLCADCKALGVYRNVCVAKDIQSTITANILTWLDLALTIVAIKREMRNFYRAIASHANPSCDSNTGT